MESQNGLNEDILITTIKIKEEFPELTKYLDEIPENFLPNAQQGVNSNDLRDYLDSLNQLLESYAKEHTRNDITCNS